MSAHLRVQSVPKFVSSPGGPRQYQALARATKSFQPGQIVLLHANLQTVTLKEVFA